jgi:hypothetical protein
MPDNAHEFLADFTEQIKASTSTTCDGCGAKLGQSYANKKGVVHMNMPDGQDDHGYDKSANLHFCNAACVKSFIDQKTKPKK